MSRAKILRASTSLTDADHPAPFVAESSVLALSDYHDEVTQEDIDRLHAHVEREFGVPEDLIAVGDPAW